MEDKMDRKKVNFTHLNHTNNVLREGSEARKDLEKFLNKKIFLQTPVKVKKNWRNNKSQLKEFGY